MEYPSSLSSKTSPDIATQAPHPIQAFETMGFLLSVAATSVIFDGSIVVIIRSEKKYKNEK